MKNVTIFAVFILFMGIGCSPSYYAPNTQNIPLLTEKGQVSMNGAIESNGGTVQASVAVSDYVGLQMNVSRFSETSNGANGNGGIYELGAGYFSKLGTRGVYEAYGLVGLGSVENSFPQTNESNFQTIGSVSSNFTRLGFQQNVGLKFKYFEVAAGIRMARLDYFGTKGDLEFNGVDQVSYLTTNSIHYLFEPSLTLRAGMKNIKLQMQMQTSANLTDPNFYQNDIGFSTGLIVNFNHFRN